MQSYKESPTMFFQGFGSPVASQVTMAFTPEHRDKDPDSSMSPLLFKRTPGLQSTPQVDSGKRFSDWVVSTSPYTSQKTPPTASMRSVAPGADENTPPADVAHGMLATDNTTQHFQAWLKATSSTKWTPRHSPGAATPPAAPAPSPVSNPMSISQLPASAATPATAEPRSRPIFDLGYSSSSEDEDDETNTTVGVQQVAAGAARMRAALAAAGGGAVLAGMQTLPHTPSCVHATASAMPGYAGDKASGDAAQEQQQHNLTTPMSLLSMSGVGAASCCAATTPTAAQCLGHVVGNCSGEPPASPVQKVIGLMLEASAAHGRGHHHGHGQHGTTRLAQQHQQPPASPEQQLIELMMHRAEEPAAVRDWGAALEGPAEPACRQEAAAAQQQDRVSRVDPAGGDSFVDAHSNDGSSYSSCDEGDSEEQGSFGSSGSDDEIEVAELQELCGDAAAAGTPISDIISMMLTPELKGTARFTPVTATGVAGLTTGEHPGDNVGPRVLFVDD